jgi:hypothetical protein
MASTTFIDQQTVIYAAWLNDVNNAVYNGTFPNGILNVTTVNCTTLNATNIVGTLGNDWSIGTSASKLYFINNGVNVASIDTSGNLRILGSTITGTTP